MAGTFKGGGATVLRTLIGIVNLQICKVKNNVWSHCSILRWGLRATLRTFFFETSRIKLEIYEKKVAILREKVEILNYRLSKTRGEHTSIIKAYTRVVVRYLKLH